MVVSKKILKIIFVIIVIPLLVGCGLSNDPVPTPTYTSLPPTSTPIPPPPTLQPFVVTLDGNECTLSGPTEVPPGEYPIFINNQTELEIPFQFVRNFLDEKTYQDVLDLQSEPGEFFSMPSWTSEVLYYYSAADDVNFYILDTIGEHFFIRIMTGKELVFFGSVPHFKWLTLPLNRLHQSIQI